MEERLETIDIGHLPELAALVEQVQQTGRPRLLTRDGRTLAVLSPAARKAPRVRRSRRRANPNAWLEPLIGMGRSEGPTDVSANKHKYI